MKNVGDRIFVCPLKPADFGELSDPFSVGNRFGIFAPSSWVATQPTQTERLRLFDSLLRFRRNETLLLGQKTPWRVMSYFNWLCQTPSDRFLRLGYEVTQYILFFCNYIIFS